jgi:uncharacterized protein DUF4177
LFEILSRVSVAQVRRSPAAGIPFARIPENRMSKIEYKTILLPYKTGIFQSDSADVAEQLNKEGAEGWLLSQIVLPSTVWGRANTMVAILQRAKV